MSRSWWTTPGVGTIDVGDSTLTRTLSAWTSAARPVVNRSSAAFTMPYTVPPGPAPNGGPAGWMAPFDEMFRMAPHCRGAHAGQDELGQLERRPHLDLEHHPEVLLRERLDGAEPGDGAVVDEDVDRAQLALGLLDQAGAVLGAGQVGGDRTAAPPASTIDCTVSWIVPSNTLCPASVVRADTATRAPSAAKRRAISAPMPRLAPVTMATRPSSAPMVGGTYRRPIGPVHPWSGPAATSGSDAGVRDG